MTEKERFIKALKREKIVGKVPHFELVYFLTMEKIGKVHPQHRNLTQWNQMSVKERELQLRDVAYCFTEIAKIYGHSAIFVQPPQHNQDFETTVRLLEIIQETTNNEYYIMLHGDPTFAIPNGDDMIDFSSRLYEDGEGILKEQKANLHSMLDFAEKLSKKSKLVDGFTLCSDYCFNDNPFYSPTMFAELIAPVLSQIISGYRDLGYYSIKHTDGNIMPILDQILQCKPDGLHSLDPQGGIDLKYLKNYCGDKVCLIGNVNCGLLQTGTEAEVVEEVRRSLRDGMPNFGYIFSTSNCIYTGMDLKRYELMHKVWQQVGIYKE